MAKELLNLFHRWPWKGLGTGGWGATEGKRGESSPFTRHELLDEFICITKPQYLISLPEFVNITGNLPWQINAICAVFRQQKQNPRFDLVCLINSKRSN